MSLYDAAKDAVRLAQKVDNIELIQKLLDVQQQALDMQEKQQLLNIQVGELKMQISRLKASKKFVFAEGKNYLIDPEHSERHLCPVHTRQFGFEAPLIDGDYCNQCGQYY